MTKKVIQKFLPGKSNFFNPDPRPPRFQTRLTLLARVATSIRTFGMGEAI